MRHARQLAFVLMALALGWAQEVVDRMVAVVNRRVILESELEQTARVEFLLAGKPLKSEKLDAAESLAVLDQLIDRSLLEQQIVHPEMMSPTKEELAERLKEVRSRIAGAAGDEGWNAVLAAYGLTQQDVEDHLASQVRVLRLVDLRFRGLVRVDKDSIAAYYQEQLLPELQRQGAGAPPLSEVSDKIEKILVEQRLDAMLNEWLQTLRAQAHIEKMWSPGASLAHGDKP